MAKGKEIKQSVDLPVGPAQPAPAPVNPGQIQVSQGNVPIVTIQLLNDINMKLGKILAALEKNG
jgi:hypothetical protein